MTSPPRFTESGRGVQLGFDELDSPLRDTTFVVVDLETTGGRAGDDAITEIGAVKIRGGEVLGEFATLKSSQDIENHICSIHSAYTVGKSGDDLQQLVEEAYNLTIQAYRLVGASPSVSTDTRRQINTAISAVQTLLSISPVDYNSLSAATENLRAQLRAAGLY